MDVDNLIVGPPTHLGNMSVQLKFLIDRNVPVFMGEKSNGFPIPRQKMETGRYRYRLYYTLAVQRLRVEFSKENVI